MRRLGLISVCTLAALAFAPSAGAATPCWKTVIADWSKDNAVDGRHPTSCLRQAMQNAPTDLKIYSSLEDDLQAALQVRTARRIAGVHVAPASLVTSDPSSGTRLIGLLAGLAALVLACSAVATVVRRRRPR